MEPYLAERHADGRSALWAVDLGVNVVKLSRHLGPIRPDGPCVIRLYARSTLGMSFSMACVNAATPL